MKNNYVLCHDFGYGKEKESPIKKLDLRNFEDCMCYVYDVIGQAFVAKVHKNKVKFLSNQEVIEVSVTFEN